MTTLPEYTILPLTCYFNPQLHHNTLNSSNFNALRKSKCKSNAKVFLEKGNSVHFFKLLKKIAAISLTIQEFNSQ